MKPGSHVMLHGRRATVSRVLGRGGEGDVYELVDELGRPTRALKWFHPETATGQRRLQLANLVDRPAPSSAFLWPEGLVDSPDGRFGYVMALRPVDFVGLPQLLRGQVPRQPTAVVSAALGLAAAYWALHTKGLCYRDINFGNAFMHPVSGQVLVCDNDNVGIEGVEPSAVRGTPKFWAPEVAIGSAHPSRHTDRYSLAVLLFYLLLVHHPLEGRRTESGLMGPEEALRYYVTEPLFCMDPTDESNRPDPELHAHVEPMWNALSADVRQLFVQAFTAGLFNPRHRVVDSEWCQALARLRAGTIVCQTCGSGSYLQTRRPANTCWACGAVVAERLYLIAPDRNVVLDDDTALLAQDVHGGADYTTHIGRVQRHPLDETRLGLQNLSTDSWTLVRPGEPSTAVPPGKRVGLEAGSTLVIDGVGLLIASTADL